jgi:hypothetical protein
MLATISNITNFVTRGLSKICLLPSQEFVLIYSKEQVMNGREGHCGAIKVYEISSGTCISSVHDHGALRDVTSIQFDEETHSIFTGHSSGRLLRWTN